MRKFLFLLGALSLSALSQAADLSLTFDEALQRAAEKNADLRSARANRDAAEHSRRAAQSGFLPQVSGSVGYADGSGVDTNYSAGITATQNLFSGFLDTAKVEQASAGLESADVALTLAKAQLSRDLKTAYAGLRYAQENIVLTESILHRLEENLRMVQLRFEGGSENKGAYLLTRASVAQARLDRLQAQQDLGSAQTQLGRALGDATVSWRAITDVPVTAPGDAPDFSALARLSPTYRDALAKERSAQAAVQTARAGSLPSVDLKASHLRSGERWTPSDGQNTVSATLSIPIYSGGRDYYGERAALASADAAMTHRESTESEALLELRQAFATYIQSVEQIDVSREFLEAAETRADIARAQYQNGLVSFTDWQQAEAELTQRQKGSLAARRDRVAAEAGWEFAQGKGVIP